MKGVLRCARYAFAPNRLKYCGPDKNNQVAAYLAGFKEILDDFAGMYPYLKLIGDSNGLGPFDDKVVEAYWIGSKLLDGVGLKQFYDHLNERLKKRLSLGQLKWVVNKVPQGAKAHHSFHVFNIWNRTGHQESQHTVSSMDACRISWGEVVSNGQLGQSELRLKTQKLVYENGKLKLVPEVVRQVSWRLGDKKLISGLKAGDLVTMHWGWVCEKISLQQAKNLEKYTKWHLKLANTTI